jgi:hypothetical protein
MDELSAAWLDAPGMPAAAAALDRLQVAHLPSYAAVKDAFASIGEFNARTKRAAARAGRMRKRRRQSLAAIEAPPLEWPEQLVLLFR